MAAITKLSCRCYVTRSEIILLKSPFFLSSVFQYERDGYLAVNDIFSEEEKKELIEAMDELIDM